MSSDQLSLTGIDPQAEHDRLRWALTDLRPSDAIATDAVVVAVHIVVERGAEPVTVDVARCVAGEGIAGERRARPGNRPSDHVTLIEAEAVEAAVAVVKAFSAKDTRRNVVTRGVALNHLVGQTFVIGDVVLRGVELCDPCARLARFTSRRFERALQHRGGLRAEVVSSGTIVVGSTVRWP